MNTLPKYTVKELENEAMRHARAQELVNAKIFRDEDTAYNFLTLVWSRLAEGCEVFTPEVAEILAEAVEDAKINVAFRQKLSALTMRGFELRQLRAARKKNANILDSERRRLAEARREIVVASAAYKGTAGGIGGVNNLAQMVANQKALEALAQRIETEEIPFYEKEVVRLDAEIAKFIATHFPSAPAAAGVRH